MKLRGSTVCGLILLSSISIAHAAANTAPINSKTANEQIMQLNTQIQNQLKQLQIQNQQQITALNNQLQQQIKQLQASFQSQLQQSTSQAQNQLHQVQTSFQQQMQQLQKQINQIGKAGA